MPEYRPFVRVVVVTYSGRRFIEPCVASLVNTPYPAMRVLVVDNGSTYDASAVVRARFAGVDVEALSTNAGFTGGANAGIRRAMAERARYIAVFNDDTEIRDPRWLDEAVDRLEADRRLAAIGFRMIESADDPTVPDDPTLTYTDFLNGFALVYRADALAKVGLYDETYFVYYDETDLQARLLRAGYTLGALDTPIFHLGEGTTGASERGAFLEMRNSIRYSIKHRSSVRTVARILRILDVACSPRSLFAIPGNHGDARMRGDSRLWSNFLLLVRAIAWNVAHLAETTRTARKERQRARAAVDAPIRPPRHRKPRARNRFTNVR